MENATHDLGVFGDINEKDYHASAGISKHGLDLINQSGAHYKANSVKETKALIYGGAFHMLVLEPGKFNDAYIVNTEYDSFRTKLAREWKAEMELDGFRVISQTDFNHMRRMNDAILAHEYASVILDPASGIAEQSIYWVDDNTDGTGKLCRCRPDFYNSKHRIISDLKTTVCAGEHAFARQCAKYRYHVQEAFYTYGSIKAGLAVDSFVFIAIEKEPPYAIGVYTLDSAARGLGVAAYRRDLNTYSTYFDNDNWPGYSPEIREISLPRFADIPDEY